MADDIPMADNIPEVETAEPETKNADTQMDDATTIVAEDPNESAELDEEAAKEAEAKEAERKKAERFKRVSGFFLGVLYILLILVVLFEAGAAYLWLNFDSFIETQNEELTGESNEETVTSAAYANWTGTYKPTDWPEPASDFADAPPYGSTAQPQLDADVSAA